jgi:hypothetical protein
MAAPYHSVFCAFLWPRHPGHSGGEIRDFHLLHHLLTFSTVDFVGLYPNPARGRPDILADRVGGWKDPASLAAARPDLVRPLAFPGDGWAAAASAFHHEVAHRLEYLETYGRRALQDRVDGRPDFLLLSPQVNPMALRVEVRACSAPTTWRPSAWKGWERAGRAGPGRRKWRARPGSSARTSPPATGSSP